MSSNGGPAFPRPAGPILDGDVYHGGQPGMTLLDWFAGQVMAGYMSADPENLTGNNATENARDAYAVARAMLAEKERREKEGA